MKFSQVLLIVILSAAVAFGTALYFRSSSTSTTSKETTYARILRTGEIHCGYTSWNPLFYIDPKTNEKTGIFHDLTEETASRLGVKVIWQEEIGWGTITESVRNGRVDMACAGYWLNAARIKNVGSSAPQLYSPLYIWVRQDDDRHFNSVDDFNSSRLTLVHIDGSAESQIEARRFPSTNVISLPELATNSDEIEMLVTHKADFFVADAASMNAYMAKNPGKIRGIFSGMPVAVFPNVMLLPPDDPRLKEVIDDIMRNIEYDGTLDVILKKYGMSQSLLRNPPPTLFAP